jgi:protein gp37
MGETTAIEWTDHTFNPVWGCVKVSPACDNCYAAAFDHRLGGEHWGAHAPLKEFGDKHWAEPLKWDRAATKAGVRRRVFCASMADVFDNRWPDGIRDRLWRLILATPSLDWLLLTKRPQNIAKMLPLDWRAGYPNVWLGTTVENQEEANRRIPHLLSVPAAVRFLSCEPLLGPLDLEYPEAFFPDGAPMCCSGYECGCRGQPIEPPMIHGISWVICGGESGHSARPMHPDWAVSLRDQCAAAGVPFLFKQWGSHLPGNMDGDNGRGGPAYTVDEEHCSVDYDDLGRGRLAEAHGASFIRFSHKNTGRLLDGKVHDGFPEVRS